MTGWRSTTENDFPAKRGTPRISGLQMMARAGINEAPISEEEVGAWPNNSS
jgi:hypothetical protein